MGTKEIKKQKNIGMGSKPARKKTNKKNVRMDSKPVRKQGNNNKQCKNVGTGSKPVRRKIIKWTSLIIILVFLISLLLLSDLFNIKQIIVTNNNTVKEEEILNLSGIKIEENMFKFLNHQVKENIKTNPYIESVKIHRMLNGTIKIEVKERVATYMLQVENKYAYINNQGYVLEISEIPITVPTIVGVITENLEPGARLKIEDLKKLDTVLEIFEIAKSNKLDTIITQINIEDVTDYKLIIESEFKLVHLGDSSSLNEKLLWLKPSLEDAKGEKGEIFIQDVKKIYFRKEV